MFGTASRGAVHQTPEAQRAVDGAGTGSTGHVLELREVERLRPFETALGEHLKHWFDAPRAIQAADGHEDHSGEAFQVGGEHPGAAIGAEVSIQALARLGDIVKRLRLAADQRKIILGHAEERGRFTAGRLLAVKAVTDGDEGGIGIELELYGAARAPTGIFLCHRKLHNAVVGSPSDPTYHILPPLVSLTTTAPPTSPSLS